MKVPELDERAAASLAAIPLMRVVFGAIAAIGSASPYVGGLVRAGGSRPE